MYVYKMYRSHIVYIYVCTGINCVESLVNEIKYIHHIYDSINTTESYDHWTDDVDGKESYEITV